MSRTEQLAHYIAQRLEAAIQARGFAVLSVSGGTSPIPLFHALRIQPLDWSRVRITLVDERCVPATHPHSNALLIKTHLLQDNARVAQWIPMIGESTALSKSTLSAAPFELADIAGAALQAAGTTDVLLLGMGADGHTASLFPQALNLDEALDKNNPHACIAMAIAPAHLPTNAPFPRITQPLAQLLRARHLILPISGADKWATLQRAQAGVNPHYPISYVLHQTETPVALWMMDTL